MSRRLIFEYHGVLNRYYKILGFALLGIILARTDLSALGQALSGCRLAPLVQGFGLCLLVVVAKAIRWNAMLRAQGLEYPIHRAIIVYLSGIYIGLATPGRLGELARALYVKRDGDTSIGLALSSVVADRILDFYALLAFGLLACYSFELLGRLSPLFLVITGVVVVAPFLLLNPGFGRWFTHKVLNRALRKKLQQVLADGAEDFFSGLERLLSFRLIFSGLMTAVAYFFFFLSGHELAAALSIPIRFLDVVYTFGLANLLSLIPITVAGIGTRDAVFVLAFSTLGLGEHQALAFSALILAVFYLGCGALGFACFAFYKPPSSPAERVE